MIAPRRAEAAAGVLALVLGLAACGGEPPEGAGRGVGSALWPSAGVGPAALLEDPETVAALGRAGVETLFLEAVALGPAGVLERRPVGDPGVGLAAVLVVRAPWSELGGLSARSAADLAEHLVLLAVEREGAGTAVRGVHLLPSGELEDPEAIAAGLGRLARELPDRYPLSLHLDAARLDSPAELDLLISGADLLVGEVYGQRAAEPDRPEHWDLERALARARRLDALGRPFLAAVAIGGRLAAPAGGEVVARSLPPEALGSDLVEVEGIFAFEGFHRQQLELTPRRPLEALGPGGAPTTLPPGRRVRLARPTAPHLAAVVGGLRRSGLQRLEGVVWTEARGADATAVPLARLPAIVEGVVGSDLRVELERVGGNALRVRVTNRGDPTAWALREHNAVQIDLAGAAFGAVELGGFERVELGRTDPQPARTEMQTLRDANRARLFFGWLESGGSAASGILRVRPRDPGWTARVEAFALEPTGELVRFTPETPPP